MQGIKSTPLATIFFTILFSVTNVAFAQSDSNTKGIELTKKMIHAVNQLETISFKMALIERQGDDEQVSSGSYCNVQVSPRKSYIKIMRPDEGPEVLLIKDQHDGKALISPNAFPYFNVYLHPKSSLMRGDFHHSVESVGMIYIASILNGLLERNDPYFIKNIRYLGDTIWQNKRHARVEYNNPNFHFYDYTVQPGETLESIAEKLLVNDYMLLTRNPEIDDYEDIEAGQVIKVPNFYGKRIEIFVNLATHIPTFQYIEDDKGLYAQYDYKEILLNPVFTDETFSPDNPKYGF